MLSLNSSVMLAGKLLTRGSDVLFGTNPETQKQIDDLKATMPKLAIPRREVGDRFRDMDSAVKCDNRALAAYLLVQRRRFP